MLYKEKQWKTWEIRNDNGWKIRVQLVSNKKRLFRIDIQTKLYETQNIFQWFSHYT